MVWMFISSGTRLVVCRKLCFRVINKIIAKPATIVKSPARNLLRFSFSFLLVEKKERKKRKRVRSVLGGMMKMMLLGWEQNNQE